MSPPTQAAPTNVYLLPLTDGGAPDVPGGYIQLPPPTEPPSILRFVIGGTSSICREGSLWVNMPEKGEQFDRKKYREFKLVPNFNQNIEIDVPICQAGAFDFCTSFTPLPEFSTSSVPAPKPTKTPTYYIDVSPSMKIQGKPIPIEALIVFSCLSKFMGKFPDKWEQHLNGIAERGYNMVHFTPLNVRGESNSPYSIADQLAFDPVIFPNGEKDIAKLIKLMEEKYSLMALTDVVWNHTANNSPWLLDHPEAGYSVRTAPHLKPALELDSALLDFSNQMGNLGYPTTLHSINDLSTVMEGVKKECINKIKFWEFYVCDIDQCTKDAIQAWKESRFEFPDELFGKSGAVGINEIKNWSLERQGQWFLQNVMTGADIMGDRFQRKANALRAAGVISACVGRYDNVPDESSARKFIYKLFEEVNLQYYKEYDDDIRAVNDQLFNRIKYVRLDDHGPKLGPITKKNPLIESYFTRLPRNAATSKHHEDSLDLVNNGWVWAADVLRDNAGPKSKAYLRREVIVWGDCVKLRYGAKPEDNPYLWDHIGAYTKLMAKHFHGFRIDNCHSTPLPLAQYMLDQARQVRPDLVVCAELFSGSEAMDYMYVEQLAINCLIREAMQAWNTQELSRLVHRHAGVPIGSFETDEVMNVEKSYHDEHTNGKTKPKREVIHRIKQKAIGALFMDCTHDNETPAQKRDARDTLPTAALVAMCASATGSVFGFDEIYPELIELVHETRPYVSPYSNGSQIKVQAQEGGIGTIKKLMNQLHSMMGKDGYTETFIHHDNEYITVHRVHPQSRKGFFCIAHTSFPGYGNGNGGFPPVYLPGTKAKQLGAWMLEVDQSQEAKQAALKDQVLRGLPSRTRDLRGVSCKWRPDEKQTVIEVGERFPPGSIALFETWIQGAEHSENIDKFVTSGAAGACSQLSLTDLNYLLYRCDPEERDATDGRDGCYNIPGHGSLVYAGLQGWWSVLKDIVKDNNLGHPICNHLREGYWALDYCVNRLEHASKKPIWANLDPVAKWLKERCDVIKGLPSFLCPRYFALLIQTLYSAGVDRCIELMSDNIQNGQQFLQELALVSVQVIGYQSNASLWPDREVPSCSAGLPHFSNDWARCWGRDIMISLSGIMTNTGRYNDAKEHILAFASVLKHGMIPNLLGSAKLPRYNSRDSIWFFLQCIQDYTKKCPDGTSILQDSCKRRFLPWDDTWFPWDDPRAYSQSSTIEDIIQEALQKHATGQNFREHNAGPAIDSQMKDEGFNLKYGVDWSNGMVFGGNQWNCGTWMDKMGESAKAGNQGWPGTPRDGGAVEINGMCYSTVAWCRDLSAAGKYKYKGVTRGDTNEFISFADWADLIKANFERCYYVPNHAEDDNKYDVNPSIINRRGIYKDLYRSGKEYEDYQLRPNFAIAMVVAPDLFDPEKALHAISIMDKNLRGPQGIATLDPSDYDYRPNYVNSDDSDDFHTAKGRNYHQGPEWVWPMGYFCRAMLKYDLMRRNTPEERTEAFQQITRRLKTNMEEIKKSPWAGLTELTNQNGALCSDSSPTQAWSAACLIDLFEEARELA